MFLRTKNLGDKKLVTSKEVTIAHVNHDEVFGSQTIGRIKFEISIAPQQQNFAQLD